MTMVKSFFDRNFVSQNGGISALGYLCLFLTALAFFTPGLTTIPPTDADESLFAQASRQMIETGNYTDIRVQDEPRYKKPIGIYWLQTTAVRLVNPDHLDEIWAYRIPSQLGAILAVLFTAATGAVLFGARAGWFAGLIMAGSMILNVESRLAKTDAMLLGTIVVAQFVLASLYKRGGDSFISWGKFLLFWGAVAAGILIKGPINLLVIGATIIWLRFGKQKWRGFSGLRPWLGIAMVLLLVSPWFIAIIHQSHGAFIQQSAGNDLFNKILYDHGRGFTAPGLHTLFLFLVIFPFGLALGLSLFDIWKTRLNAAEQFCIGWIVIPWLVFEFTLTKLVHYTLPMYPAIAILIAKAIVDGLPVLREGKKGPWVVIVCLLSILIAAIYGVAFFFFTIHPYPTTPSVQYAQFFAGFLTVFFSSAAIITMLKSPQKSLLLLAFSGWTFMAITFGYTVPRLDGFWVTRSLVTAAESIKPCSPLKLVTYGYNPGSIVFTVGTHQVVRTTDPTRAAEILLNDHCEVAAIDDKSIPYFDTLLAAAGAHPEKKAHVEGVEFARGDKITRMTLITLSQGQQK